MGDFVFYSLLVGKAAVSGSLLATIASMIGVIGGLIITLTMFPDTDESIPALPIPIILGIVYHFSTLLVIEPIIIALLNQLSLYNLNLFLFI